MSDYIKREDAVLAIAANLRFTQPMATRILESVKSADVVEQKHAKWSYVKETVSVLTGFEVVGLKCSNCNRIFMAQEWLKKSNFCPCCGARMDGE